MTPLSTRNAPAAILLLLASAAPVWLHVLGAPTQDDCADPAGVFQALELGGIPRVEAEGGFAADAVFEGRRVDRSMTLSVRLVRSYEPVLLYWRPIGMGFNPLLHLQGADLHWVEAGDEQLPVHTSSSVDFSAARLESYVYVQGGRPVRHPIQSGLALAWPQLRSGTRPILLLLASGAAKRESLPVLRRETERWLAAAWQDLESACGF